jgi:dihydroorotate dehydrogenase electron transfer subunit
LNRYFKAKIADNLPLNSKNNLLITEPLDSVIEPAPGQFYMIETGNTYDPLLKRPFSYFRRTSGTIQFIYAVIGKGTSLMKDFRRGDTVNILGPLGTGYPSPGNGKIPLLVAGGTGIASIFSMAEACSGKAHLVYGAKNRKELLILDELEKSGNELLICTDDYSFGKEGMVDGLVNDFLASRSTSLTSYVMYACGPKPMLKALSKIAADKNLKGYASMEENMACGFGACVGCVVNTISGYKRVCKEGPVFPIEEIVWEK